MSDIAASVDLRPWFGPARDQGPRPTCLAFATSDAHAALRYGWVPLSCEYVFYHAQRRAARPFNRGALLNCMMDAVRLDGQPEENGWPYRAIVSDEASWIPPKNVGPLFYRLGEKLDPRCDQIVRELDRCRPVIILMMLSRAFYNPNVHAVVHPSPGEAPEPARRHAVVGVGYGTVDGERAILVRNSWGLKWGQAGHAWLTESFVSPRLFAAAALLEEPHVLTR